MPLRLAPERPVQAAEPTPLEWPAEHEVGSLGRPAHSPSTGPEPTRVDRIERGDEPRRAWPAPIAFESSDAPWLDHDEARSASPVAEFDLRRTHAPDLPQPPMTPALPRPRALPTPAHDAPLVTRRNERSEPGFTVDSNPPARRWPDLPPWPAPHDPWAHAADPHARDRRQRLDHEQRG